MVGERVVYSLVDLNVAATHLIFSDGALGWIAGDKFFLARVILTDSLVLLRYTRYACDGYELNLCRCRRS